MRGRYIFFLFISVFVFVLMTIWIDRPEPVYRKQDSETSEGDGKVIMVVIDRIGLKDLYDANTPNMDYLAQIGGIGLMTTNMAGSRSQRNAYITMGAGTNVTGSDKSHLGFNVKETYHGNEAGNLYRQIAGIEPPEQAVVNLGFAQAARNNKQRPYTVTIGALGTALREAGRIAAVLGNCDTPGEYKRYLVSMMMDDQGMVPAGRVDQSFLTSDHGRPFGIRTDYDALLQYIDELWDTADVFAIQLGDTSRAEDFRYEATDLLNESYKRIAIEESDAFIGRLTDKLNLQKDLIMIVTPLGPARDLAENNRLTPVIIAGKGFAEGLLSSASTKRMGVITNLDIGQTILDYFGIPRRKGQLGNRVFSSPSSMDMKELLAYNTRLTEIHNQRAPLLKSYVTVLVILLAASLISIFFFRQYLSYAAAFLQFMMAVPIAYLVLPVFHQPTLAGSFMLSWLLALVITGLLSLRKLNVMDKIGILCILVVVLLAADQFTGANLIACSPLGYDIISGARFYGMGNEYMGILIGAVCTGIGTACELWGRKGSPGSVWFVFPLFALPLVVLAHPRLGANVGGTISLIAAMASFIILNWKKKIRIRHMTGVGAFMAAFLIVLFLLDSTRAVDSQTHMGQTVSLIRENGILELFYIAIRKIEMNIKLFRYTIWTRVFLLSLLSIVLLLFRPIGIFRNLAEKTPFFVKGITSGVIGCIAALLVNDSGIVAAGTSMIYLAPPVLLVVMMHLPRGVNKAHGKEQAV
ncbi:MAG TPA: hypothetical protein GX505_12640 [Clostridiales bacterium]|nr:hypothetical protein [Clostridiales bacterium]